MIDRDEVKDSIVDFIFSHTNINQINLLLTLSYFPLWTMTVVDNIELPPFVNMTH